MPMPQGDGLDTDSRTIADFGAQWTSYTENEGYYASTRLFADIVEPLLDPENIRGKKVVDIGSGTGRIVNMLLDLGAGHVTAVEPSDAFAVLKSNTKERAQKITYLHLRGDQLDVQGQDYIVSFGVLHHVVDPDPIVRRGFQALKPGGQMVVWLYGREGNALYLALVLPLRKLTKLLPDPILSILCTILLFCLNGYVHLCRIFPLPMRQYMLGHIDKLSTKDRRLTIFDQLNPAHAKYYCRQEAHDLLHRAGFKDVRLHQRHGYSWTVAGTRPAN